MHPVHLAANIDVRVGHRHPVERHMGRFACLRPGHLNLAYFKVGDGRPDTYTVSVPEHPSAWEVEVAMPGVTGSGYELRDGISAEMTCDAVRSVIAAHGDAEAGRVAFGIARASTGQRTTVEFELERARE